MLLVKTKIGPSKIHGIGLFADEFILKGTKIWVFNPLIDLSFSKSDLKKLSSFSQEQLHKYYFLDKKTQRYILCGDDARFFNHSDNPNCDDHIDNITIAIRDIKKGEELTVNYKLFYGDVEDHLKIKSD